MCLLRSTSSFRHRPHQDLRAIYADQYYILLAAWHDVDADTTAVREDVKLTAPRGYNTIAPVAREIFVLLVW